MILNPRWWSNLVIEIHDLYCNGNIWEHIGTWNFIALPRFPMLPSSGRAAMPMCFTPNWFRLITGEKDNQPLDFRGGPFLDLPPNPNAIESGIAMPQSKLRQDGSPKMVSSIEFGMPTGLQRVLTQQCSCPFSFIWFEFNGSTTRKSSWTTGKVMSATCFARPTQLAVWNSHSWCWSFDAFRCFCFPCMAASFGVGMSSAPQSPPPCSAVSVKFNSMKLTFVLMFCVAGREGLRLSAGWS